MQVMKEKTVIKARDGTALAVTRYVPDVSNYTTVIVAPAMGCRQKRYSDLAAFLCEQGYIVYTFDYRGVGRSVEQAGAPRGPTLRQWASIDLDTVILAARKQFPGHELVGLAHGVSGEIVGLAPASTFFSRLILADAALSSWALANWRGRLRLLGAYFYEAACRWIPGVSFCVSRSVPLGVFREWLSWSKLPNGLFHHYSNNNYQKLRGPVLSLNFTRAPFSAPRAVKALLGQFANAHCSHVRLKPLGPGLKNSGHYPFYDKRLKDVLWKELVLWMQGKEPFWQNEANRKRSTRTYTG